MSGRYGRSSDDNAGDRIAREMAAGERRIGEGRELAVPEGGYPNKDQPWPISGRRADTQDTHVDKLNTALNRRRQIADNQVAMAERVKPEDASLLRYWSGYIDCLTDLAGDMNLTGETDD
jgi:hypothetical protein